jgi:hypothetical protein
MILFNGDRFSSSTTHHQGVVRREMERSGLPYVIIPYSVLDAAGIDRNDVRIVDNTDARTITVHHHAATEPKSKWNRDDLHQDEAGIWRWTTRRHVLGESLVQCAVRGSRTVTCKACAGKRFEIGGGLPWSLPNGMEWGDYHERNEFGEKMRIPVVRERVPVPTTELRGWRDSGWTVLEHPQLGAFPLPAEWYPCGGCRGAGKVRQETKSIRHFLSGFDHGEPHLAYFFCEMPNMSATTVEEAYELLKPDAVKLAEELGRTVHRQGDIFAIETTMTDEEVKSLTVKGGAYKWSMRNWNTERVAKELGIEANWAHAIARKAEWHERGEKWIKLDKPVPFYTGKPADRIRKRLDQINEGIKLLGTNHTATEVRHLSNGTTVAKGIMRHVPDGRTNDHVNVDLGNRGVWCVVLKNTVPVRKAR